MRQIAELEWQILKCQQELPELLALCNESERTARELQEEAYQTKIRVQSYEKARAVVKRAIRLAQSLLADGEFQAAILELTRAASIERTNAVVWRLLAECRLNVNDLDAAEEACRTSVELEWDTASVALLGKILFQQARYDEAITCYKQALAPTPPH